MSSLKLHIFELAIVIILLQLLSHRNHSFTDLFAIGFVGLVLSPQVWIPAKEVAGKGRWFTALLHLDNGKEGIVWACLICTFN